jgi:asparagine synthetase B (glutamine-hydrolysing)
MAVSIESRVPLLDRRIVDFVASMPPAMKFKGAERIISSKNRWEITCHLKF